MKNAQHLRIQFSQLFPQSNKKSYCVGRESNPGQLLGWQLCSPLYHRRFDVEIDVTDNVDFLVKSGQSKFWHGKSALIWNPLLIRLPPWSDQRPPSWPSFFRYELSMFSDSPFTRWHLEEKLIGYMTQEKCKLKIRVLTTVNKIFSCNGVFTSRVIFKYAFPAKIAFVSKSE